MPPSEELRKKLLAEELKLRKKQPEHWAKSKYRRYARPFKPAEPVPEKKEPAKQKKKPSKGFRPKRKPHFKKTKASKARKRKTGKKKKH
ncbi:MAG: hypothetical protein J4224_02560 [Candidatus Diapherotrites archaeon]|uniref:Uncharacterized protein n=1 Tax=Candidatus Iainarchaeum sp. TaxID=3101447 RepID=A0A7J4IQQ1_9ARCH|nr:hypothetical protein [Candidatus Diapherotrites archaeon]HIH07831.1 hypothetical protein [Candidatus Diapherotrites archaeon]